MKIGLYTLTSGLHDAQKVDNNSNEFISAIEDELGFPFNFHGCGYESYGESDLDLIYVRTGGTEGIFKSEVPYTKTRKTILLTSGKNNSLAASMEILSYLALQGRCGEILHGSTQYIAGRIKTLGKISQAMEMLDGANYGIVGKPSDWLISSCADAEAVKDKLGINLVDIPISKLIESAKAMKKDNESAMDCSLRIYESLRALVREYSLKGLTLRCFDLLTTLEGTGCLALARLNEEGITGGCEGDVPAMLSMAIVQALTGQPSFQANPSQINPDTQEVLFAHCTIPLNMVSDYTFDTHFESGIGIAVKGRIPEGDVTIFKVSGDLKRHFVAEGTLTDNPALTDLCRTQARIRLNADSGNPAGYFLHEPIGNHHIIICGHHKDLINSFFQELQNA